jgi:dihydrolipoamide dehydrogenase
VSAERTFDVVVIGAGPAGENVAGRVASGGLSVALVEQHLVGGECSYYACMPSKALLRPGELFAEVQRVPGVKEAVTGKIDAQAVLSRRDEVIHNRDDSSQMPWLEDRGIELFRERAVIQGKKQVQAGDTILQARQAVVVATGSGAAMPPIPGLRESKPWTNREATTAEAVPGRLLVLGGGVVGVELSQAWSSLGSRVILVEAAPRLIAREEQFASEQVEAALRDHGVDVRTGVKATAVARDDDSFRLELEDGSSAEGDELLVAIGRVPHVEGLGLESVGIEPDGPLEVDDTMLVSGTDWLYAIGDVNGRSLLTHIGKYQSRIAGDVILGRPARATQDGATAPRVIFTDPEVAAVGHTMKSAREAGLEVRSVDHPTAEVAGASFRGRNAPGTSRLVIDERRKLIVGATFTGPEVAEALHAATIAVVGEVPLDRLWHAVPAFPTRSEVWLRLLESYGL